MYFEKILVNLPENNFIHITLTGQGNSINEYKINMHYYYENLIPFFNILYKYLLQNLFFGALYQNKII